MAPKINRAARNSRRDRKRQVGSLRWQEAKSEGSVTVWGKRRDAQRGIYSSGKRRLYLVRSSAENLRGTYKAVVLFREQGDPCLA